MFQQFGFLEILVIAGFVVLVLGFIVLFRLAGILKASANKNTVSGKVPVQKTAAPVSKPAPSPAKAKDDTTIIAVLAAAVAAYMGTSPNGLEIRSYRRLKNGKPSWSRAGRYDTMKNQL